jgi:hypothetical protein
MKNHVCLVCGALAGITIPHFSAFAETARPNATAAPCCHSKQAGKARRKLRRIATMHGEPIKKQ